MNQENPEHKEQRALFEKAIEAHLDITIQQLLKGVKTESAKLKRLKDKIYQEIVSGGDDPKTKEKESYIDDLELDKKDLQRIFENPKLNQALKEEGIKSLEEFIHILDFNKMSKTGYDASAKILATQSRIGVGNGKEFGWDVETSEESSRHTRVYQNKRDYVAEVRFPNNNIEYNTLNDQGEMFGNIETERQYYPELTADQYLNLVAEKLKTPDDLEKYITAVNMMYVHDDPEKRDADFNDFANINETYDNWQLAEETVERIKNGKMLGDCDDWAFLAKEILRRQGKNAEVLGIPQHAICVWAEKRTDGKYNLYSMGTYGLDINGNWKSKKQKEGFTSLEEGLDSLMEKYRKSYTKNYHAGYQLEKLDIPKSGERTNITLPIEILIDPSLEGKIIEAETKIQNKDYSGAIKIYEDLTTKYPDQPFFLEQIANIQYFEPKPIAEMQSKIKYAKETAWKRKTEILKAYLKKGYIPTNMPLSLEGINAPEAKEFSSESIKLAEAAIKLNPNAVNLALDLARYYTYKMNPPNSEKAESILKETIKQNPKSLAAYIEILTFYDNVHIYTDYEKYALAALENSEGEEEDKQTFEDSLIYFYFNNHQSEKAKKHMEKLYQGKIDTWAFKALSMGYRELKEWDKLEEISLKTLFDTPVTIEESSYIYEECFSNLVLVYAQNNALAQIITLYEKLEDQITVNTFCSIARDCIKEYPEIGFGMFRYAFENLDNSKISLQYYIIYAERIGDKSESLRILEKAMAAHPDPNIDYSMLREKYL